MLERILHFLTWPVEFLFYKFFAKFNVIGLENIKGLQSTIIVGNHGSWFDPYIIGSAIPWFSKLHPVYYLAEDAKFDRKFFRVVFWFFGAFRGRVGEGVEIALQKPLKLLAQDKSVGIFLEYCYDQSPARERVHDVIALTALKSGKPIVPVFIYGIFDGGLTWKKIITRQRKISVAFGKPIYPLDLNKEQIIENIYKAFLKTKLDYIKACHREEKVFWNAYAQFYYYLERATPYQKLINDLDSYLPEKITGKWTDLGSGSGAIISLLAHKNHGSNAEIFATDVDKTMIEHLKGRFNGDKVKSIRELDLAYPLDMPDSSMDGITANLVLSYIIHHNGEIGLNAFTKLLGEIYRVLKPSGKFVWSTPKKNVNFSKVFTASWKNILDPKNIENIYYGPSILRQALQIQDKGRRGIYHFLSTEELEGMLLKIGFKNIRFSQSMADQVNIISCEK